MSGECEKCGEHCLDCICIIVKKIVRHSISDHPFCCWLCKNEFPKEQCEVINGVMQCPGCFPKKCR